MTSDDLSHRLASLHRPFRLIVTGGGTGGHTYPALTAVRELQSRLSAHGSPLDVLWVGTSEGLEARVAPAEGIPFKAVPASKLPCRKRPPALPLPAECAAGEVTDHVGLGSAVAVGFHQVVHGRTV